MPLKGFLRQDDSLRLSSIGAPGKRPKHIETVPKKIKSKMTFITLPCESHARPHPSVPVELYEYSPENRDGLYRGTVRCCPLCWTMLESPS